MPECIWHDVSDGEHIPLCSLDWEICHLDTANAATCHIVPSQYDDYQAMTREYGALDPSEKDQDRGGTTPY